MSELSILYPRQPAQIYETALTAKELKIREKIEKFKKTKGYIKFQNLLKDELNIQLDQPKFKCWNCKQESKIRETILHDFVSYSNGPDEDRYDDYNIICPNCGKYSYITNNSQYRMLYKETKYIKN